MGFDSPAGSGRGAPPSCEADKGVLVCGLHHNATAFPHRQSAHLGRNQVEMTKSVPSYLVFTTPWRRSIPRFLTSGPSRSVSLPWFSLQILVTTSTTQP